MATTRYVIIGGGIAGTTAAETIRQRDPGGEIVIVSDEPHRLYSRVMLSKPDFFLGRIPFERVWMKTERWYAERNIQLLAGRRASVLDLSARAVTLDDGRVLPYSKLLLAFGSKARTLEIPGTDKKGVFYLRTVDDASGVIAAMRTAKRAISVGGGFISFEMADLFHMAGLDVTLVLRESHFWEPWLDIDSGRLIERKMEEAGVHILRNAELASVDGGAEVTGIALHDGRCLPCEVLSIGIGIYCPADWVKRTGVAVGQGVICNEYLETNWPDIYAAGEAAEYAEVISGERTIGGTWLSALLQGKCAGANMTGDRQRFRMVPVYTAHCFGTNVAFVGNSRPMPDRRIVVRSSAREGWSVRCLVKGDHIVGATLIGRLQDADPIAKLIELGVDVSSHFDALADPSVDLKTLLPP